MKNIDACLSHKSDDWRTPSDLYDFMINHEGFIDCFPYQSDIDEFTLERGCCLNLYANPPFSKLNKIPQWIKHQVNDNHNLVVLLIPSRTDTKYFHELLEFKPFIFFIKGRLHFNDSKSAPFPCLLMVFDNNTNECYQALDLKKVIYGY